MTLTSDVETNEKFFDHEAIVEHDAGHSGRSLIGEVGVVDTGEPGAVAVTKHMAGL